MGDEQTIYWDSFGLQSLHTGVGRHGYELHKALLTRGFHPQILPSHPHIHAVWQPYFAQVSPSKAAWMRLKPFSLWRMSQQLKTISRSKSVAGIVHGLSNYNVPRLSPSLSKRFTRILTVHDLIPLLMPEQVSLSLQVFLRWQMPRAVDYADAIICVSRWTQQSLEEFYPSARGKTFMIPNGLVSRESDPSPKSGAEGEQILLTVARDEPYKRLDLIAKILRRLPKTITWDLVTDLAGQARLGKLDPRLRVHSNLSASDLERLHRRSIALVHPSLLEGYCLPAVDSVQWGRPVVFTSGSGIDETVGLAGMGLSARAGPDAWADHIIQIANSSDEWRQRCKTQLISIPNWDEVAARTLKVYGILSKNLLEAVREQNS